MDIGELHERIETLTRDVRREGAAQARAWASTIERPAFSASAANLAHYMALRRRDLTQLQRPLMVLGLSSLGRLESRVAPTLSAVSAALAALQGRKAPARSVGPRLLRRGAEAESKRPGNPWPGVGRGTGGPAGDLPERSGG
jgi:pyruvate kinase